MSGAATLSRDELARAGYRVLPDGSIVRDRRGEPILPAPPSQRAWPVMRFELPRPVSNAPEVVEQAALCRLFREHGCEPASTSQFRKSKMAAGIPDLWVFLTPIGVAGWWESKSGAEWRFSDDQLKWAVRCSACNTLYGAGDRFSAEVFLRHLGIRRIP